MNCAACKAAEREPRADYFRAGCSSCEARALAVTGAHLESLKANSLTPQYRQALITLFGDQWREGHEEVKRWAMQIERTIRNKRA